MDLYPRVNGSDPRMHRTLTPRPRSLPSTEEVYELTIWPGQLGTGSWIGKLCPHAHDGSVVGQEKKNLKSWCTSLQLEADMDWKIFGKIKVALRMGYDKKEETNLTRRKNGI